MTEPVAQNYSTSVTDGSFYFFFKKSITEWLS